MFSAKSHMVRRGGGDFFMMGKGEDKWQFFCIFAERMRVGYELRVTN